MEVLDTACIIESIFELICRKLQKGYIYKVKQWSGHTELCIKFLHILDPCHYYTPTTTHLHGWPNNGNRNSSHHGRRNDRQLSKGIIK